MTARRPRPTVAQRDLWSLVASAVAAGTIETARQLADDAMSRGWERYALGMEYGNDGVYLSPMVPRGWTYYARDGYDRSLLVHPDAAPLLADWAHLGTAMKVAAKLGSGLVRLDEVLGAVLIQAMTAPDDTAGLTALP